MAYTMEFNEERNTWCLFDTDTHEWLIEGTYEDCTRFMENAFNCMYEEETTPNDYYV